jgi:hypothetical protein
VRHVFSHRRVTYRPALHELAGTTHLVGGPVAWAPLDRLDGYPLPVAQQRIAALAWEALERVGKPPTRDSG